ncbi:MAG: ribbon-helix-helix protein, CopG family [Promethearchaeota archaeon]
MTTRTTVAIDEKLRKRLKKLSAWLDITQSEVIKRALTLFEKKILQEKQISVNANFKIKDTQKSDIKKMLEEATKIIWKLDPNRKMIQQKLFVGTDTLDEIILNNWKTGLEE